MSVSSKEERLVIHGTRVLFPFFTMAVAINSAIVMQEPRVWKHCSRRAEILDARLPHDQESALNRFSDGINNKKEALKELITI